MIPSHCAAAQSDSATLGPNQAIGKRPITHLAIPKSLSSRTVPHPLTDNAPLRSDPDDDACYAHTQALHGVPDCVNESSASAHARFAMPMAAAPTTVRPMVVLLVVIVVVVARVVVCGVVVTVGRRGCDLDNDAAVDCNQCGLGCDSAACVQGREAHGDVKESARTTLRNVAELCRCRWEINCVRAGAKLW